MFTGVSTSRTRRSTTCYWNSSAAQTASLPPPCNTSIQGLNCEDPDRKDLLMDIGTEELSHLEVVGCLARMHLKPKFDREAAEADPLIAIAGGGGVNLFNSQGNP
jgi:Mn-containing catalase